MKEIKNKTIYTPDNVKKFLEVYYFEKVKVPRLIINILILLVIIYFFTKDNRVLLDYTTFIFCLFGVIELNTTMLPKLNYRKLEKAKDSVLNTKIEYLFKKMKQKNFFYMSGSAKEIVKSSNQKFENIYEYKECVRDLKYIGSGDRDFENGKIYQSKYFNCATYKININKSERTVGSSYFERIS